MSRSDVSAGFKVDFRRAPPGSRPADPRAWLDRSVRLFSDRILPFDTDAALIWGRLGQNIGDGAGCGGRDGQGGRFRADRGARLRNASHEVSAEQFRALQTRHTGWRAPY
jgi:hypothetical protein